MYQFSFGIRPAIEIQSVYALISLLLLVGLAHIENMLKERQRNERQTKKMELIGQLTAGIAHDFSNTLTVIQGYADLLAPMQLDSEAKGQLDQIYLAVDRCSSFTRHLMLFSRRQKGEVETLDLNVVIRNLIPMLRRLVDASISLKTDYGSDLPSVTADISEIERIIMNLAVNARDAMPKGGALTIGATAFTLDEAQVNRPQGVRPGLFVCLRVCDTGIGIPPKVLSHIYEPFFTTKEPGKGTGLGLATVLEIAKRYAGWIDVRSRAGQGTEFKVYFPGVPRPAVEILRKSVSHPAEGGAETILLVEDEDPVRELAAIFLKENGYQVIEANCGAKAFKIWDEKSSQIDLLVTDIVMPGGISGYDLANELVKAKPGLGVIFTSGYDPQRTGQRPMSMAGARFVPKPYDSNTLLQAIRACRLNQTTENAGA